MGTLALVALLVASCKSPSPTFDARQNSIGAVTNLVPVEITNRLSPEWLRASSEPFTLGPGDRLEIEIFGEPNSRSSATVGPDGKIYFYLLPGIDVWGLTLAQTRDRLASELEKHFYQGARPHVGISLRGIESKRVWLLGRFQNSGVYLMPAPMTLLESISLAGGTMTAPGASSEIGDLRRSFVVRQGNLLPVDFHRLLREGDMSQNIFLHPDDFVYVPSAVAREVFVLGAVRMPKPVEFASQITLVSAIAQAGGTIKDAHLSHVAILRGSLSQPQLAIIDFKPILEGKAQDVKLEPSDIIYVPFTPYRTLVRYADLILTTFVRAVAINEGARAVSRDAIPVGVNIGIGP